MSLAWKKLSRSNELKVFVGCAITFLLILNFVFMLVLPVLDYPKASFGFSQRYVRYVHPHNMSIKGITFTMNSYDYNLAMHLVDRLESGKKVESLTMDSLAETMTPVTAVSSNHFHELLKHLDNLHQFVPNKRLIVYDLGLTPDEVKTLKRIDYVEYRYFDLSIYPKHVRNLDSFAWKPLIIHEVLVEQGGVMWMDLGVKMRKPNTKILEEMVNNNSGFLFYLPSNSHSIMSATHPKMFEYLPLNNMKEKLPQGSGYVVFNTREIRTVFKWAIVCSLVQECIAPKGSTRHCSFSPSGEQTVVGCHGYDQSMFSILLANQNSLRKTDIPS